MIVNNINREPSSERWYRAHEGGLATMLFDSSELEGILFFAFAVVQPGKALESHIDPYEEIYYVLKGKALMRVDDDEQEVQPGDAIWIPCGSPHSMHNNGEEDCAIVVAAGFPR
jgi:mannose-6-phosphate isomerase-like protein (cupin superfamily)